VQEEGKINVDKEHGLWKHFGIKKQDSSGNFRESADRR
jgi:hypothetical protein